MNSDCPLCDSKSDGSIPYSEVIWTSCNLNLPATRLFVPQFDEGIIKRTKKLCITSYLRGETTDDK